MIQIDTRITQIKGFDENCLWFLYKMTQVKMDYTNTHPKLETLEKWTGWDRKKVIRIAQKLEDLGLLEVVRRFRKSGGKTSNEYKITTKLISYLVPLEGTTFELENAKNTMSQNGTSVIEAENGKPKTQKEPENAESHEVPKKDIAKSQNATYNLINSNSLKPTTTSTALEEFLEFELDPVRKSIIQKEYGLTDSEIQLTLLNFKDEPKYRKNPPENPGKVFSNWLIIEGIAKFKRTEQLKVAEKATKLAEQRVEQFHEKKTAIIEKVGTNPKPYSGNYHSGPVEPEVQLDIGRNNPIGDYRGRLAKTTARVYSADFPDEGAFKDYMAELLRIEKLNIIAMDFDLASIKRQFPAVPKLVLGEVEPAFMSEEEIETRRQKALNQS